MTVETEDGSGNPITKSGPYNGNGATSVFDYDFQIQAAEELLVTRQNADLTETVLTLTTDYTVSGVGVDTGGQITLVAPATSLPTGTKLVIQYNGDFDQLADYSSQGGINLGALEASLDKLTMHLRQLLEQIDRSVKVDAFGTVDVDTLTQNVAALGAIVDDLSALAAIIADISAVADIDTDVTTVAGLDTEVAALGAISTQLAALGAIVADISTVAGIDTEVAEVAALSTEILALTTGGIVTLSQLIVEDELYLPTWTTVGRPTPGVGQYAIGFNTTTGQFESFNGTSWGPVGGAGLFKGDSGERGDTVNGANDIFRVHKKTLTQDTTIDGDENAVAVGPLEVASGVTLTVESGGTLVIL